MPAGDEIAARNVADDGTAMAVRGAVAMLTRGAGRCRSRRAEAL